MIGHFIAVPTEVAFRATCEYMVPGNYALAACNVGARVVHEGTELLVNQLIIGFGINKIAENEHNHHSYIPIASGILFGMGMGLYLDYDSIFMNALIGTAANFVGTKLGGFMVDMQEHHE